MKNANLPENYDQRVEGLYFVLRMIHLLASFLLKSPLAPHEEEASLN